ncbi:regulator of G-protein signaling 3-like isoform X2 [Genypterus blacodes]|uniref:regulator of G-protein signaling 3-like isoform X2 n=1 Tax=Genypterus blacodes TaxID=154954 RepID=UPI003F764ECE
MSGLEPCSSKRPHGGVLLQLHQEAQWKPPACKRKSRREGEQKEEMTKRTRRGGGAACTENRSPCRTQTHVEALEQRRISTKAKTGGHDWSGREPADRPDVSAKTWTGSENRSQVRSAATKTRSKVKAMTETEPNWTVAQGAGSHGSGAKMIQSMRAEVKVALIRKTRIQIPGEIVGGSRQAKDMILRTHSEKICSEKGEHHRRSTWIRTQDSTCEAGSTSGALSRTEVLIMDEARDVPRRKRRSSSSSRGREGRSEKESRKRRVKIHPSAFRGRGQLHLSIIPEKAGLVIQIHEAKGLMGKSCRSCDSYVQLTLTPDLGHTRRMRTETVMDNKNPKYKQNFMLCDSSELLQKRLLVSVWRRRAHTSHLIGCMSFGIRSLVLSSELVAGWFYLLGEEFGRSKHLKVTSQHKKQMGGRVEEADMRTAPPCELRKTPDSTLARTDSGETVAATKPTQTVAANTAGLRESPNHCPATNSRYATYDSTRYANAKQQHRGRDANQHDTQQLMVSIIRGKDGFGFTICSDCPVRVQEVDPGSPAHVAGLRQSDWLLQLNGVPVETWKCAELAHAIRTCPSHIVLVVWRGVSEVRCGGEALLRPPAADTTTVRKLLPHPTHGKHGRQRGQSSGVRSSLGALGSLWSDRKEREEEVTDYSARTATLKGTHVMSSNGDNYIILSPVNPGSQLLQPVYQERNSSTGRLFQTHPSRPGSSLHTATLPAQPSSFSCAAVPSNYGNYQNCTIVQSHVPCSSYGSYVTLAPKTLIFPVFVQPLDMCSPERTLLMSEEMILHQENLLPTKVTVLIYSDLLLLTREDEVGRCNVLQSPVYLNTLQLREGSSSTLFISFLQTSVGLRCVFSLEAFSLEQKSRVSICLHDNIQRQLVATETQLSDVSADIGVLSLHQSELLLRSPSSFSSPDLPHHQPSSPYTARCCSHRPSSSPPPRFSSLSPYSSSPPPTTTFTSLPPPSSSAQRSVSTPIWKERVRPGGGVKEEEEMVKEERQQGEGESASETSEGVAPLRGRSFLSSPVSLTVEEEGREEEEEEEGEVLSSTYRPAVLRRSLSEGSLLLEPRSPRFLSDSTIHRLIRPVTFDPAPGLASRPPSLHTLRKQLTREGGTLQHMLLLLNGTKDDDLRNQRKKKTKHLAADVRSRLAFLQRRNKNNGNHGNSLEKALRNNKSPDAVLQWAESLEALLANQYGLAVFRHFLRSEFSEENLDFWLAVERFKRTRPFNKMAARATKIYTEFISTSAARQVNVDSTIREATNKSLHCGLGPASFQLAQDQVFSLMETDSYPRFLRSHLYAQLANHSTETVPVANERQTESHVQ